jgi:hypothetical protein
MIVTVVISYPNGAQEEHNLAGVPRVGESVRLPNGKGQTLKVIHVLWLAESDRDPRPQVIVEVRPRDEG